MGKRKKKVPVWDGSPSMNVWRQSALYAVAGRRLHRAGQELTLGGLAPAPAHDAASDRRLRQSGSDAVLAMLKDEIDGEDELLQGKRPKAAILRKGNLSVGVRSYQQTN